MRRAHQIINGEIRSRPYCVLKLSASPRLLRAHQPLTRINLLIISETADNLSARRHLRPVAHRRVFGEN